jgi:hypothetical protein
MNEGKNIAFSGLEISNFISILEDVALAKKLSI